MFTATAILIVLMVVVTVCTCPRSVWYLGGRPIAVSLGLIKQTADDFVVQGWKAERRGEWAEALAAYDEALRLRRGDADAETRRVALLSRCRDLTEAAAISEREWLAILDPLELLDNLVAKHTSRKLRLLAVACCCRVLHLLTDDRSKLAVEAAEKYADQLVSPEDWMTILVEAGATWLAADLKVDERDARHAAAMSLAPLAETHSGAALVIQLTSSGVERHEQVMLINCIFGHRYYTREVVPSWLTSNVLALAGQMYESRDFSIMPILADALQDAGCAEPEVLNHCRQFGGHVKGCWVVDLLLGKQ